MISRNFDNWCLLALTLSVGILAGCANNSLRGLRAQAPISQAELNSRAAAGTPVAANSSQLTIWHESFETAAQESRQTGKPILADFTGSDWCGWCIKLKKEVFSKSDFEAWARNNVVLLEVDYPRNKTQSPEIKAQNERLKQRYAIDSYPTVLVLDAAGNVHGKVNYAAGDSIASWTARCDQLIGGGRGSESKNLQFAGGTMPSEPSQVVQPASYTTSGSGTNRANIGDGSAAKAPVNAGQGSGASAPNRGSTTTAARGSGSQGSAARGFAPQRQPFRFDQ